MVSNFYDGMFQPTFQTKVKNKILETTVPDFGNRFEILDGHVGGFKYKIQWQFIKNVVANIGRIMERAKRKSLVTNNHQYIIIHS